MADKIVIIKNSANKDIKIGPSDSPTLASVVVQGPPGPPGLPGVNGLVSGIITPGTYGGGVNFVNSATVDTYGRVTGITVATTLPSQTGNNGKVLITDGINASWTLVPNSSLINSSFTISAGAGLSGGGLVALGSTVSLSMPNTGPGAGIYGGGLNVVASVTLDAQGRITAVSTGSALPDQTSNNGKYLTTDGSNASWVTLNALPSQTGNNGKFLTTDGTNASWGLIPNSALVNSSITLNTGNGLQGGGAVALGGSRTLDLLLNASGGLTKALGLGTNELGIAAAGVTNAMLVNSSLTVTAGTGLSGGGAVSLGATTTLSMPNVGPGAGSIGGGSNFINSITLDAQGRITAASASTVSTTKTLQGAYDDGLAGSDGLIRYTATGGRMLFDNDTNDPITTGPVFTVTDQGSDLFSITVDATNGPTVLGADLFEPIHGIVNIGTTASAGHLGGGTASGQPVFSWGATLTSMFDPVEAEAGFQALQGRTQATVQNDDSTGARNAFMVLVPSVWTNASSRKFTIQDNTSEFFGIDKDGSIITASGKLGVSQSQLHAIPAVASDTYALLGATQTLTSKTISGVSNTLSNIANASLVNSSLTVTAGTGLSGGGAVALGASTTLNLANTTVTPNAYGSATQVGTFTVDAQGRLTVAGNTAIQIAESQVTNLTTDLAAKATDSLVVHLAGIETITGAKTFSSAISVNGYSVNPGASVPNSGDALAWNGTAFVPTASGGGSVAIGGAVTSSTPNGILYIDGSNNLAEDPTNLYWDYTNKRLGIGGTPGAVVDSFGEIRVTAAAGSGSYIHFYTPIDVNSHNYIGLSIPADTGGSNALGTYEMEVGGRGGFNVILDTDVDTTTTAALNVYRGAATTTPKFVLREDGKLGILQASPTFNLDVTGTGRFTSDLTISGTTFTNALSGSSALTAITTNVADYLATVKNTNTSGYSAFSFLDSSGTARGSMGYGNSTAGITNARGRMYINRITTDFAIFDGGSFNFLLSTNGHASFGGSAVNLNYQVEIAGAGGSLSLAPTATSSGTTKTLLVVGAANTAQTASTEASDVDFAFNRTVQFNTGALTTQRAFVVRAPTYSFVAASTITTATTLSITGAPVAGTNATITNPLAFNVEAGNAAFGGKVGIGTTNPLTIFDVVDNTASGAGPRINTNSTDTSGNYMGYQLSSGNTFKGGFFRLKSTDEISIWNPTTAILKGDTSGNWTPQSDNGQDWGAVGTRWRTVYALGVHSGTANLTLTPNAAVVPPSDNTKSLGTSALRWTQGWFKSNLAVGASAASVPLVVGSDIAGFSGTQIQAVFSKGAGATVSLYVGPSGSAGLEFGWDNTNTRAYLNAPTQPIVFMQSGVPAVGINTAGNLYSFTDNGVSVGLPANRFSTVNAFQYVGVIQAVTPATSVTINPTLGEFVRITLSATTITSVTISTGQSAQVMTVEVINDAVGSRAVPTTWTNVRFAGGSYTNTLGSNAKDTITFRYNSTDAKWDEIGRAMNIS